MVLFRRRRRRRDRELVCRQAVELMTDYIEGTLPSDDRARFEAHLAGCPHCTEYLAQIRDVISAAGQIEPDALPPDAVDDLVNLYEAWRQT